MVCVETAVYQSLPERCFYEVLGHYDIDNAAQVLISHFLVLFCVFNTSLS